MATDLSCGLGVLLQVGFFLFSPEWTLGSQVGCLCHLLVIGFLLSASLLSFLSDILAFWHSSMKVPKAGWFLTDLSFNLPLCVALAV